MILQFENQEVYLTQNLLQRNIEINRAYNQIADEARSLLKQFDSSLYRTYYEINHTIAGGNIIKEWCCMFWSISLIKTKQHNLLIYFSYDQDALNQFGSHLFNKVLRVIFRYTMFDTTHLNIESCVRIEKSPKDVHSLFKKQLKKGETENTFISIQERLTA
mgnify:FL=1